MSFALLQYDYDNDDDDGEKDGENNDENNDNDEDDTCFLARHAPQDVSARCLQHCKFQTQNDNRYCDCDDSDDNIDDGYCDCDGYDDDIDNDYQGQYCL